MFASSATARWSERRLLQPLSSAPPPGSTSRRPPTPMTTGSWALGERVGPDCDENKVLGLPDGSALLHARATPRRRSARSTDGGETISRASSRRRAGRPGLQRRPRAAAEFRRAGGGGVHQRRPRRAHPAVGAHLDRPRPPGRPRCWWTPAPRPTRCACRWPIGALGLAWRPAMTTRSCSPGSPSRIWVSRANPDPGRPRWACGGRAKPPEVAGRSPASAGPDRPRSLVAGHREDEEAP